MKWEHLALSVTDRNEIERFYQDILGMELIKTFQLDKILAFDIFGIADSPEVFLMQKDEMQIEIFISPKKHHHGFDHLCISTDCKDELVKKAKQNSYRCFHLKRDHSDLLFISDKCGNSFEIKEALS